MSITNFGNVVTCYSKKAQLAIANLGFTQGVHYWEIICPSKCIGVEVGVIKNWGTTAIAEINKNTSVTHEFNTSTARNLCLRLDMNAL